MERKEALYEGKAKIMYATDRPDEILVYYKDDATAGNGAKKGTIAHKGIMNNKMTAFFFDLLAKEGVACDEDRDGRGAGRNRAHLTEGQ